MTQVPKDLFTSITKPSHFKVAVAFCQLADDKGEVQISTKELAAYSGVSESSLTRAFRELENIGFLETKRTKKGFNKFSFNVYKLHLGEKHEVEGINKLGPEELAFVSSQQGGSPLKSPSAKVSDGSIPNYDFSSLKAERSTSDQVEQDIPSKPNSSKDSEILRISSSRKILVEVPSSDKGSQSYKTSKTLSLNPKDFRTRARRPVSDWTTWDVAAEFSFLLQKRLRGFPTVVNIKKLEGALRSRRSTYGTTAKVEMLLMKRFFEDKSKWSLAIKEPHKVIGAYLNLFKTDLEALKRRVEKVHVPCYTYASDGRQFEDSIPGRKMRDKYEEKLGLSAASID